MKRPVVHEQKALFEATVAVEGITTGAGEGTGLSLIDAGLAGAGANSFVSMLAVIYPGDFDAVDSQDITAFTNGTGEVTVATVFKGGQVPAGTPYKIVTFRFVPAEVAALAAVVAAIKTLVDVLDLTTFDQEVVGATVVDGVTWKALLDRSATGVPITKPTKICGFMVTKAGGWAGNAQVRIVDGAGNKIFPFPSELEETVDFEDAVDVIFDFPVVVPVADGYIFQFRSTNAADAAGKTLQLNTLDVIEVG